MTYDTIFDDAKIRHSIGSIGNVWKGIKYLNTSVSIAVEPTEFGEALIMVDRINSRRTSRAMLCTSSRRPTIHQAQWHHILYLNELEDPNFIGRIKSGIVSADICKGKTIPMDFLKYIDWLFVSGDEEGYNSDMVTAVKQGVIVHTPKYAEIVTSKGGYMLYSDSLLSNCNTLGAGDFFAASTILSLLHGEGFEKTLFDAHNNTKRMILNEI